MDADCNTCDYHEFLEALLKIKDATYNVEDDYAPLSLFFDFVDDIVMGLDI